jgi:hypothetical protein
MYMKVRVDDPPPGLRSGYRQLRRAGFDRHNANALTVGACLILRPESVKVDFIDPKPEQRVAVVLPREIVEKMLASEWYDDAIATAAYEKALGRTP